MATMMTALARSRHAERVAPPDPEVPERPQRRRFTREYKLRILAEIDAAPNGEAAAILRREGPYSSHLAGFREQRISAEQFLERVGQMDALLERLVVGTNVFAHESDVPIIVEALQIDKQRGADAVIEAIRTGQPQVAATQVNAIEALLGRFPSNPRDVA